MINVIEAAQAAERIVVPKGDDNKGCIQAFQEVTDIEVPIFSDRAYKAVSQGREFFLVKGKDIPRIVSSDRFSVDVGLTGYDSYLEFAGVSAVNLAYQKVGRPMCEFALLAPTDEAERTVWLLDNSMSPLQVETSFPRLLSGLAATSDLNITVLNDGLSGSMEIMPELSGIRLVADLVTKGDTARANGVTPIRKLIDVYPVLVVKDGSQPETDSPRTYQGIDAIDQTLTARYRAIDDPSQSSYTIRQMRDPNKRRKKVTEEAGEVIIASCIGTTEELVSELADSVLAGIIDLKVKSEGRLGLGAVIDELIARNVRMTSSGRNR